MHRDLVTHGCIPEGFVRAEQRRVKHLLDKRLLTKLGVFFILSTSVYSL